MKRTSLRNSNFIAFLVILLCACATTHLPTERRAATYSDAHAPLGRPSMEPYLDNVRDLTEGELLTRHDAGALDATIQLARVRWWRGDAQTPIDLLRGPAEQGIPVAQYLLGSYLNFKNRDPEGSVAWLKKAADHGHPVAQETLAAWYENGSHGFPLSKELAFELYLAAARQGLKPSQLSAGAMLCRGVGVFQDKEEARKWIALALENATGGKPIPNGGCK